MMFSWLLLHFPSPCFYLTPPFDCKTSVITICTPTLRKIIFRQSPTLPALAASRQMHFNSYTHGFSFVLVACRGERRLPPALAVLAFAYQQAQVETDAAGMWLSFAAIFLVKRFYGCTERQGDALSV